MPFGNGKYGGLCYRPSYWEWIVNKLDILHVDPWTDYSQKDNIFTGRMHAKVVIDGLKPYAEVLKAVENKDGSRLRELGRAPLAKLVEEQVAGRKAGSIPWNPENLIPAFLRVYSEDSSSEHFSQRLHLSDGIISARVGKPNDSYSVETICDPDNDVFVVQFEAQKGKVPLRKIVLARPPHDFFYETEPQYGHNQNCIWVDFRLRNHFRYVVLVRIEGACFKAESGDGEIAARLIRSEKRIILHVTCVSCLETEDPLQECIAIASSSTVRDIRRRNAQRWQKFWNESGVEIDDDFLENLYYFHQYAFACTSGNGMKAIHRAAGLYGLWTNTDWIIWANNVYGDVNIEMAYQHVCSSNHLKLFEPFTDMVWSCFELAKMRARKIFKLPGACFASPLHCMGPWYCLMMWDYYAHSRDIEYLRRKLYPIMKEVGNFYAAFLRKDEQGNYYLFGTMPPERGLVNPKEEENQKPTMGFGNYCKNTTIDLALLKQTFKHLIEASRLLEVDNDMIPVWQNILEHFPNYPTGQTKHGTTIFDMEEYNRPEMCHHPNTVAPVYPCREMHFSSPGDTVALAKATVHSCWENIRMFYTFNGPWVAVAFARLGLGNEAERLLSAQVVDLFCDPGGFLGREMNQYYTPYQPIVFGPRPGNAVLLETGNGLITALNEMLVQEQDGTLFLFPALPAKWRRAAFQRLRIPGAFKVSGKYAKGQVLHATIQADKPGKLKVKNPWGNRSIEIMSNHRQSFTAQGEIIDLSFEAGEECQLRAPVGEAARADYKMTIHKQPKEKITLQGFHLFLGMDKRSRITEAVEKFCFPYMTFDEKGHIFEGEPHGKFVEYPQNVFYKFDFGGNGKADYSRYFSRARFGDTEFVPVTSKTAYSGIRRYGWLQIGKMKNVHCAGADPLTMTAVEGKAAGVFALNLEEGDYQFLLLHGNSKRIYTGIQIQELGCCFAFAAPDDDVGIEGFGCRVATDKIIKLAFSTKPGYCWRVNALLLKKAW